MQILQAAWIVDDSDLDDSEHDDEADDGMVLDENDSGFLGPECNDKVDLDDDQASLQLHFRESDEETDVDSVMMVSVKNLWNTCEKVHAFIGGYALFHVDNFMHLKV